MLPLEAAVIDALSGHLRAPVIERAVKLALAADAPATPGRRQAIERELATLDAGLRHYAEAVATAARFDPGGDQESRGTPVSAQG